MNDLSQIRSLLFAPGNDAHKLERAATSGAGAVIADLEDSVPPGEKESARRVVERALRTRSAENVWMVRTNALESGLLEADVAALTDAEPDVLVLPKATPEAIDCLCPEGPPIVAIVETAVGVREAHAIGAAARVLALALGAVDLSLRLRLRPLPGGKELLFARSKLVVDSAAAGIRPPFDAVYLDVGDERGLKDEAELARGLGFGGKMCIHPRQIGIVESVWAPSRAEIEWAQRVLAAHEEALATGRGAVALEGRLIDHPVVEQAREVLAASRKEEA